MKNSMIISLLIIAFLATGCTHEQNTKVDENPGSSQQQEKDNVDWKIAENDSPTSDFASLYHLSEVPTLKKLLINTTFLKHVTVNQIPYLHGFSSDGRYAAFISYTERDEKGFLLQIFDIYTGDTVYTTFIPNSEDMIESKYLATAQLILDSGFKINVPPNRLVWKNDLEYKNNDHIWNFNNYKTNDQSFLRITKDNSKDVWQLLPPGENNQRQLDLFTFPGDSNWVIFVFNYYQSKDSEDKSYEPLFINLNNLTSYNSVKGKEKEADIWLYGKFQFIYDQWNTVNKKGFFAISSNSQRSIENNFFNVVEQWIYLDPTGKMSWYGNSRGIFNDEAKPINAYDHLFYYRINLKFDSNGKSLKYFIVDQYDQDTKQLLKTFEFKWDAKLLKMVPIEKVQVYS